MKLADIKNLKGIDKDDVLAAVGLSLRRSSTARMLEATAFLVGGIVLGAGMALLLAPKPGKMLREELSRRIAHFKNGRNSTPDEPFQGGSS